MREFVLHPEAYSDLDDLWEYIAFDNVGAADRTREEIYDAIDRIVTFSQPRSQTTRPQRKAAALSGGPRLPDRIRARRKTACCDCRGARPS